ncbi:MAG: hypothetical protein ABSB42_02310 [Tepidisphaeraceae bacterium]|jgi:hypothetical protein
MIWRTILVLFSTAAICGSAAAEGKASAADEKYTLHENLHVGQKVSNSIHYECKVNSTATTNGKQTATNTTTALSWKVTLAILDEKGGSATRAQADVDPDSFDTAKDADGPEKKIPCPFAGKTIVLARHPDESISNDFSGNAADDDLDMLNNFITPDEDFYPDIPVAVGETWDNTAKAGRHAELGPNDRMASVCRLDWIKTIDGKQMAQISNSVAIIYHEDGNVEEDTSYTATVLVDVAAGMIVKGDEKGSSKYTTPATEATQVSGGTEFTFQCQVAPAAGK